MKNVEKIQLIAVIENIANEYGGPAVSLPSLLKALPDGSVESTVFSTYITDDEHNSLLEKTNIDWIKLKKIVPYKLGYAYTMRETICRLIKPEHSILYSNNLWNCCAYFPYLISKNLNVPHVIAVRGSLYDWSLKQSKWLKIFALKFFQKKSLQSATLIHATCLEELQAIRTLGIKTPVAVIPHGVAIDSVDLSKKFLYLQSRKVKKRKVLFMSRLHKKKGLDVLLSVWEDICQYFPHWELLIAGPDYANYYDLIRKKISDGKLINITCMGMLIGEAKASAFFESEFFVLPSYTENFGIVIAEALSAGLPVITTDATPWGELESLGIGAVIPAVSHEALKINMLHFMAKSTSELSEMGANAKKYVDEHYSWAPQAEKFNHCLEAIHLGNDFNHLEFVHSC